MELHLIWFILLGVLLAGYAILDGFDLGVGMAHPMLGSDSERDVAVRTIGPLWDGNEVWLVTFGGALFAAFPEAYATILSAFYIPVMLLLFCLILRAVSVDFRNKVESSYWRRMWDVGFFLSSLGATFVFGVAAGNLIQGIPLDEAGEFTGTEIDLISVYTLATGVLAIATFTMHGVIYLILKTTKDLRNKLSGRIWHFWGAFLVAYILVTMITLIENRHIVENIKQSWLPIPFAILNVLAIANIPRNIVAGKFGQAFLSSSANIICLVALFGLSIYPEMVFSTGTGGSLSMQDAASSDGTLKLMLIIAAIGFPMIVAYTSVIYWTFRQPISEATKKSGH